MTMCMLHPSAFKCPHSKRPIWGFVKCHQKGGKKSKENQKLNLTSNMSEIGTPQKLTWMKITPQTSIFFLIFLSFYLRSSSWWLRIVLPVLLEQSCNELMAFTVPWPCSQWISGFPKQYESSNHPQTKLIYSQKYQQPGFLWIFSTTNLSLEDIWALIPERFPMRVDEMWTMNGKSSAIPPGQMRPQVLSALVV